MTPTSARITRFGVSDDELSFVGRRWVVTVPTMLIMRRFLDLLIIPMLHLTSWIADPRPGRKVLMAANLAQGPTKATPTACVREQPSACTLLGDGALDVGCPPTVLTF
jgi:hypothetical protein